MKNGMKQTEIGEIPVDWEVKKIGQLADLTAGGTPSTSMTEYWGGNIPWMSSGEVNLGKITNVEGRITELGFQNSSAKIIPVHSILMALAGQGKTRGKVAFNEIELCTNQSLAAIMPRKGLNYKFLFYNLESRYDEIRAMSSGDGGRGGLNLTIIKSIQLALPPLPEQRSIAEILSTLDEKMAIIDEQLAQTQELKKGLMQRLLTKGIGHTQFKDSPLGEIPASWEVASFRDYTKVNQGLQIAIADRHKEYSEGCLPYITIQFLNERRKEGNIFFVKSPANSVICYEDEILMTRTGNTGIVITGVHGVFHNNFFKVGFNKIQFDRLFLFYYLNSSFIQALIKLYAGSTTIPDLNHGDFYKIPLLKPDIEEQRQIAEIFTTMDDKIGVLQDKKAQYHTLKKGLMQQLLTGQRRVRVDEQVPALV